MPFSSLSNQGTADSHPASVHAPGDSSQPIQQPIPPQTFAPQENQNKASEFFPHAQSRRPETSRLPKNNLAQRICSRQQINCVPRAPNATLPPFPTTNHPAPAINVPLHPSAPPSPNLQQHNSEPTHPNVLPIPNPVFAPNLTAPIPHAPLINPPLVNKTFRIIITKYTKLYVPFFLLSLICLISLLAKTSCQIWVIGGFNSTDSQ